MMAVELRSLRWAFWKASGFYQESAKVRQSEQIGDRIVAAIERYHHREGHYPAKLEELVPRDIPAILPPIEGRKKWEYWPRSDGSDFDLEFWEGEADVPRWYYAQRNGRWLYKSF